MSRLLCTLMVAALVAGFESGCHKRHVRVPAPAAPQPSGTITQQQPAPTPAPAPAPVSPAPAVQPPTPPPSTPPQPEEPYQKSKPAPPQPPPQAAQPPRRTPRPAEPNPAPPPRLGDVLTPDQQRQYNASIDQSLAQAQSSLSAIANHRLTKEQQAVVAQIQSFIQQAQTSRRSNLPAAKSLAERAEVLARDLVGSLR